MIECCFYTHAHYILTYRCDTQITSFVFPSGDDLRKYGVPPSGPAGEEKSFIVLSRMYLIHGLGGTGRGDALLRLASPTSTTSPMECPGINLLMLDVNCTNFLGLHCEV